MTVSAGAVFKVRYPFVRDTYSSPACQQMSRRPTGNPSPPLLLSRPMQRGAANEPLWWYTLDGDADCLDMHARHYSRYRYADARERKLFIGPGEKFVLRTERADAVFAWRNFIDDCIDERTGERQQGVNCAVFRNEGQHLSSSLIRSADAIADLVWTDRRHYTYVDCKKVASANPGYCFIKAGWKRCGFTKSGLLVLERLT